MISSLHGKVESLSSDSAVINVNGVGFQVFMPTSTLSAIGAVGKEAHIYTHLHLREDNVALFGFASPEELALFQLLIGVSGLGPRLALAMLSGMSVEHLVTAIATGSIDLLTIIPGIGKKVASRIVVKPASSVLIWLIMAYKVEVFPLPVGPVMRTIPWGFSTMPRIRRRSFLEAPMSSRFNCNAAVSRSRMVIFSP